MKILIISHNPISTYQSMGKTFLSLFHFFQREELCQLYIYPSIPDVDKCNSYFRVTDKEALQSCLTRRGIGREIGSDEIRVAKKGLFENEKDESIYRNPKNQQAFRMLLRDDVWKFSNWFNKRTKKWLNKEKPTCIFVAPGTGKFLYNIAIKISKKYNLPIVSYICDDYYFLKPKRGFLEKKCSKQLKRKIKEFFTFATYIVAISNGIGCNFSDTFRLPYKVIMTGSNYPICQEVKQRETINSITYMGNICCNRYKSLAEIGIALDEINAEHGSNYELHIYTAEKNEKMLQCLTACHSIKLNGFIAGDKFVETFHSADMLLHVEAFDEESIDLVKYSISTKIADSLGSGICLFAYGPACVSSMKHLIENDCAIYACSKTELKEKLLFAFTNRKMREEKARNALIAAHKYHDQNVTSREFYSLMEKISEGTSG